MYHDEKLTNGILHFRSSPNEPWLAYTIQELSERVIELQHELNVLKQEDLDCHITGDYVEDYGVNRAEFLEAFPNFADSLCKQEEIHGLLEKVISVSFDDGRCVYLYRFERVYMLSCWNPHNEENKREFQAVLSPEAMLAFHGLYGLIRHERDQKALREMIKGEPTDEVKE